MIYFLFLITLLFNTTKPIEVEALSLQGSRPYQQDRYYVAANKADQCLAAIFDGHGTYGDEVAEFLKNEAPAAFNAIVLEKPVIEKAFRALNNKLYQLLGKDKTDESGATGLVVLQNKDHFFIAHCGDSRAVWGYKKIEQTVDHTASNPKEIERVGKKNVKTVHGVERLGGTLMVTRSFGDVALKKIGLSATPEIAILSKSEYPYLLLGCDGVFDLTSGLSGSDQFDEQTDSFLWSMFQIAANKNQALRRIMFQTVIAVMLHEDEFEKGAISAMYRDYTNNNVAHFPLYPLDRRFKTEKERQALLLVGILTNKFNDWTEQELSAFVSKHQAMLHDNTTLVLIVDKTSMPQKEVVPPTVAKKSSWLKRIWNWQWPWSR
ncbi:protein serine/threonine phosphatase 2C family protein [bacterium]|nr:MAG: protein serine/threonine phosphatase 2C family protein [bacterium]QQR61609.1 MAG: protein serine/threonine phosphatase 2C family protein [bacterium]QQR62830.1 MAG: protein serine/threonine phosphatase 2C family protein [bacterium]